MNEGALVAGRYRVGRALGQGGTGSVFEVADLHAPDRRLALKALTADAFGGQTLHEYQILARLEHPGCVRVRDVGRLGDKGAFLVMDLVDGKAPSEGLGAPGATRSRELVELAALVLETLVYLHAHGVVHGDLKPDNLLCVEDPDLPTGTRPILLDFGLARRPDATTRPGGTLAYMAPELITGSGPTPRTDLYSLGIMLYELVAGVTPFRGRYREMIRGQLELTPTPLTTLAGWVDEGLSRLIHRLLAKAPGARPASASEALGLLADSTGLDAPDVAADASRGALGTPQLAGRDEHLRAFDLALAEGARQQGVLLCLDGPSGSGRTRLLDEFAVRCVLKGARALRWSGRELVGPGADLMGTVLRLPRKPGDDGQTLRSALQELAVTPAVGAGVADATEDRADWQRRASFLVDLLPWLANRGVGCLLLDDVEAGGFSACEIAVMVARAAAPRGISTVIAGLPVGHPVQGIPVERLALPPLAGPDMATFVRTAVGEVEDAGGESFSGWLLRASGGSPEIAREWLHTLVLNGRLALRGGRWRLLDPIGVNSMDTTGRIQALTDQRLAGLSPSALNLAVAASLFGERFDPEIVAAAGLLEPDAVAPAVAELRSHRVISIDEGHWPVRFAHPALLAALLAVAETVLTEGVTASRKRLAESLRRAADGGASHPTLHAALGRQLLSLGEPAGADAIVAAVPEVFSEGGYSEACDLLFAAEAELATMEPSAATRARTTAVQVALGDIERSVGHLDKARLAFEAALATARHTSSILRRLGQIAVAQSDFERGLDLLEQVLTDLDADGFDRFKAAHDIGYALMHQGHWEEARESVQLAYDICEETGDPVARARTLELEANIAWMSGHASDAIPLAQRAVEAFDHVGDALGAARARMQLGTGLRLNSRWEEALAAYERSLDTFRRAHAVRFVGKCQNNLAIIHFFLGDFRAATKRFEAFREVLETTGEMAELVALYNNLGSLYRERGLFQRSEMLLKEGIQLARQTQTRRLEAMLGGNLAELFLRQGRYEPAMARLDETERLAEALGVHDELVEVWRRRIEVQAAQEPGGIDVVLWSEALALAQERRLVTEEAPLWRLKAGYHRARGERSAALEAIDRARDLLEGAGALEHGRLTRERARVLADAGELRRATALLEELTGELERMDAGWDLEVTREQLAGLQTMRPAPVAVETRQVSWAPQISAVVDFSQRLGAAVDLQDYLDRVVDGVMELAPTAERCFVIVYDDADNPIAKSTRGGTDAQTAPDEREVGFSRTITEECLRERRPLYVQDAMSDPRFSAAKSVMALRLCTVLALPLMVGPRCKGVLYVDTSQVMHRALQDAQPVLELIAGVVASGVERAELLDMHRTQAEAVSLFVNELKRPVQTVNDSLQTARGVVTVGREHLQAAFDELQRLGRMVDNLSDYTEVKQEREHHTSIVSILLAEAVEAVLDHLGALCEETGVTVESTVSDALPFVLGNRDQIIQLFSNLLTYALRRSEPGASVSVAARGVADVRRQERALGPSAPPSRMLAPVQEHVSASRRLEVAITVTGAGVDGKTLSAIFRRDGDAAASISSRVGLVVARMIVERHGGDIWTEANDKGRGTVIRFTLPALQDDE